MNPNKPGKMKVLLVMAAQILTMTLLAACATVGATGGATVGATGGATTPLTACHATGDPANPYVVITITNDISPVPANGCPASPVLSQRWQDYDLPCYRQPNQSLYRDHGECCWLRWSRRT